MLYTSELTAYSNLYRGEGDEFEEMNTPLTSPPASSAAPATRARWAVCGV